MSDSQEDAKREFVEEFCAFRRDYVLPAADAAGVSTLEVLLFHIFFQLETLVQEGVSMKATVVHITPPEPPPEGEEWKR